MYIVVVVATVAVVGTEESCMLETNRIVGNRKQSKQQKIGIVEIKL